MPSRARRLAHRGVLGVEEDVALRGEQVALVGDRGGGLDAVGVVEDEAEVADAPDAGLRADRRLADLDPRVAERALLGLAGAVVEVDLLVRAAGDAVAPAAAACPGRRARCRPPRACTSRRTDREQEGSGRGERRHVPDHRQRAELGVQRQRHAPAHREVVDRRAARGVDPVARDAVARARPRAPPGSSGSRNTSRCAASRSRSSGTEAAACDAVGVVEDEAEVADPPDAGLRADRRLADLDPRVAERALLGLAGAVVEVDLLVRAARDAVAPAAARSWSTSTIPSSSRLYIAPDGQQATHDGFRQCSQIRGRKNMNACS